MNIMTIPVLQQALGEAVTDHESARTVLSEATAALTHARDVHVKATETVDRAAERVRALYDAMGKRLTEIGARR